MLYKEKSLKDEKGNNIIIRYYILKCELNPETHKEEWGIKIETKDEAKEIKYLTPDYNQTKIIIALLADNNVTPVAMFDIVSDML